MLILGKCTNNVSSNDEMMIYRYKQIEKYMFNDITITNQSWELITSLYCNSTFLMKSSLLYRYRVKWEKKHTAGAISKSNRKTVNDLYELVRKDMEVNENGWLYNITLRYKLKYRNNAFNELLIVLTVTAVKVCDYCTFVYIYFFTNLKIHFIFIYLFYF